MEDLVNDSWTEMEEESKMADRDEWLERAKTKLDEWNRELDELEARARGAKEEQKARIDRLIADLRGYRDEARRTLSRIEDAGDAAWDDLREGVQRGWQALSKGFRAAVEEFRRDRKEPPSPPPPPTG